MDYNLQRFLDAQNQMYMRALSEIKRGRKESHWMWFIFPQLKGLGQSDTAKYYAISGLREAAAFLKHPVLGKHLIEISEAMLTIRSKSVHEIFGHPDDLKLCSSMTLFANVENSSIVFPSVIDRYFGGLQDEATLRFLNKL
ncbi:DUF1810 domain-containing protein [Sphingobacterium alkalisoli]|uniref:DUF1810 domain-containing protein n=1 Tax=Sphingobacterium alkalisoli TaxID=1874115 RepID=A0A4U0GVN0_9SPHI|nr:DUF1810 domain-containing protein [Sphingobacterium alkalisoli]TJY62634.1 DUF1810 domain-containing protein [Sphingobacterium alkalisoli]GGH27914.1 hypothetical protein GCM10011418_38150 [Sphingobacterium alkalisoli]